jgi:hypothetical protein
MYVFQKGVNLHVKLIKRYRNPAGSVLPEGMFPVNLQIKLIKRYRNPAEGEGRAL